MIAEVSPPVPNQVVRLFDCFPRGDRMVFWFLTDAEGPRLRLTQPYVPHWLVEPREGERYGRMLQAFERTGCFAIGELSEHVDFWTGRKQPLQEIDVLNLDNAYRELVGLYRQFPEFAYFDCDIPIEQFYCYRHNLFPGALCRIRHKDGILLECEVLDSPWDTDYAPLPLRVARLHGEGYLDPKKAVLRFLSLSMGERSFEWDSDRVEDTLHSLNSVLSDWDPDLIWSTGGDSLLMPCLFQLSNQTGIPLCLDREPGISRGTGQRGRSYVSYGRVVYRDPDYPLWGRWHIDRRNCFLDHESEFDGLLEAARVSRLPVQRMARRSIGTGISSVQMAHVTRQGFPIPWKKVQPEGWKNALQLIRADRGGLTYQPRPGVYENVLELDFVSMYPSIMTNFNISPETINCLCCPDSSTVVDELEYRICEKRDGLISGALVPILDKRIEYKNRMRAATDSEERRRYKNRQTALKWLLVCCFGYLGYKNARFGRIEAHESICAISREMLLRTRELCEDWGYQVLHSLVDCVWLRKPSGADPAEAEAMCRAIEAETNLPIAVEGHYSWLVFVSSTQHPDMPVPARYFGRFTDGSLKYRGIEIRRSDQPPFVQMLQAELLERLSQAETLADCRAMETELRERVREEERRLVEREILLQDLLLKRQLSRSAEEYRSNAMTATAARQAARIGQNLVGGQEVHFLVVDQKCGNPDERIRLVDLLQPETDYDVEFYRDLLRKSAATLFNPLFGPLPGKRVSRMVQETFF